ncbi:hypothetical protein ACJ73_10243 [Blastomyces percursus]|uniref:Uncharacterized protein n=1 Tax=Blastomyces percursus TaxID=1658174 RepID=A0A1J9Q0Q9_9EURO|nr:hypothetical protein ACJ73_10243 [Blastomyces percursus]
MAPSAPKREKQFHREPGDQSSSGRIRCLLSLPLHLQTKLVLIFLRSTSHASTHWILKRGPIEF